MWTPKAHANDSGFIAIQLAKRVSYFYSRDSIYFHGDHIVIDPFL